MLLKILVGLVLAGVVAAVLVNALRPDLFRFESVGTTTHPGADASHRQGIDRSRDDRRCVALVRALTATQG